MPNSVLEINMSAIKDNIKQIKGYIGSQVTLMPIIKANGYGTYVNYHTQFLKQFKLIGVSSLTEALTLRTNGYQKDILILFPLMANELAVAISNNFIINSSNFIAIKPKLKPQQEVRTHLEIETGMGRCGLAITEIDEYINYLKNNQQIKLEGIYTHLAMAKNQVYSRAQLNKFTRALIKFKNEQIKYQYQHVVCSGGLANYPDYLFNMVRIGLLLYGYYPNDSVKKILQLKPAIQLKTKIIFLNTINKGESVGYNRNFVAQRKTKVATIPFGFADGLASLETGRAYVIINRQKAKVIAICMDTMMLDITHVKDVKLGTEVYLWDNEQLTTEQVASWLGGLCTYELLTSITSRVE
ncbi:MAG TPA: alanine racemase, partial [Bacilli bacterium]|nr:alanine racemase [Bacilli bacterium]